MSLSRSGAPLLTASPLGLWLLLACSAAAPTTVKEPGEPNPPEPQAAPSSEPVAAETNVAESCADPTALCGTECPGAAEPPAALYQPRRCEQALATLYTARAKPYLFWDFGYRYFDQESCAGYRYHPAHVTLIDEQGLPSWCVDVPEPLSERRLESAAVEYHRSAPWDRPVFSWRVAGPALLLFDSWTFVALDKSSRDQRVIQHRSLDERGNFPFYDSASFEIETQGERCRGRAGSGLFVQACGDLLVVWAPHGVFSAFDLQTGKLADEVHYEPALHVPPNTPPGTAVLSGYNVTLNVFASLAL